MRATIIGCVLVGVVSMARPSEGTSKGMPWLTLAPEVGYVFFKEGELEKTYHAKVPTRHGFVFKGHADLGGDYGALELAPLYTRQSAGGLVGTLNGVGGEVSLVYRHPSGPFHPGIGIGFHGVFYTPNDNIQKGVDIMARAPIGMTYYFARYVGLVLETGLMIGATGIQFEESDNPVQYNLSEKMEYALVFGIDILMGLRFP